MAAGQHEASAARQPNFMQSNYLLYALVVLLANSILIALTRHPGDDPRFWARFLRALGRLSLLRHGREGGDSPGTLHWPPGSAQPMPKSYIRSVLGTGGALLLALALLPACVPVSRVSGAKATVAQGVKNNTALMQELTAYSVQTERRITTTSRTLEESERRAADLRGAVDLAGKLLERSTQNLRDVAKALGVDLTPASPVGGAQ